jgi:Bacterial capsule synthesis protein PGA_cap
VNAPIILLGTGDLIIDEPDPDMYFDPARTVLQAADVVVGHVEVPFTLEREGSVNVPLQARDPKKLGALKNAGFRVASLAANHVYDEGKVGVRDTIEGLRAQSIAPFGAGMNLTEARQPAVLECRGVRLGFLSYNLVGPKESWAGAHKAGAAYVYVLTSYELDHATPGGAPTIYTGAEAQSLENMVQDIRQVRSACDVVWVSMHKGTVHTPGLVMAYEKQVAHAAIEAGADVVVGHHAHMLRGIEVYKDKPVFHGLGNFVTVTHALSPIGVTDTNEWALRRQQLFGFVPDLETPEYPFHPESRHAMLAKCVVGQNGTLQAHYLPCVINRRSQPEVVGRDERGERVFDYVDKITRQAGFDTRFEWRGDEVAIA